jgi:hypothetical protein
MPISALTGLYIDQTYSRLVQTQGGEFANGLGTPITLITSTGSLLTTSSFNTFTSSYNTGSFTGSFTGSLFGTASFAISASRAVTSSFALTSSLSLRNIITASVTSNTITFTKGDGTTFPITVNTGSGGGSTAPGGSSGQIQYNNSNTFGGVPTLTYDGTTLSATGSFTGSFRGAVVQPSGIGLLVYGDAATAPTPTPPTNYYIYTGGIYKITAGNPNDSINPITPYLFFPNPVVEGTTITVLSIGVDDGFGNFYTINVDQSGAPIEDITGGAIGSLIANKIYNFYGIDGKWVGGYMN